MGKTPVNIISGFLGSGKTTAIIRLLELKQSHEHWIIVVNEFGKISIDGQTLQSKSANSSVFDISGGCICCSAKYYLKENLEKITESGSFDRILIEPSGLGGVEMVSEMVASISQLELMPVICMVDITAMENPRLQRNMIYQSQIRMSDRIVFSKGDLLQPLQPMNDLISRFKELYPGKRGYFKAKNLSINLLLPVDSFELNNTTGGQSYFPSYQLSDSNYQEHYFQFPADHIFNPEKVAAFLTNHPIILRAKGFLFTSDGWILINHTVSGTQIHPCPPKDKNELVIIVEKLKDDIPELEEILAQC